MKKHPYQAPLYEALQSYADKGVSSFHTPGHKGNAGFLTPDLRLDLTELPETDSLFECGGCIRQSEERAAALFGAACTAVSAGGCTLAIQGMIAAFAGAGSKVIFSRNIHRSAINAAMLLGIDPVWALHNNDAGAGLAGRIPPEAVESAIAANPDASAVYITSPDYCGCLSDIAGISRVCRSHGLPLLVDNAHGTHLIAFGLHPITLGATASACSAHKTLPVLTGGAWLNCADVTAAPRLKSAMALFGSTSPSYLTMASLDLARAWMEEEGVAAFALLAEQVKDLRALAETVGFGMPSGVCDPVRLTLLPRPLGMTGDRAAEYFRARGVECEHSDAAVVIFILTPFNTSEDIERLRRGIAAFPRSAPLPPPEDHLPRLAPPEKVMLPREALLRPTETIRVCDAAGRTAAEAACPCPPGVPAVMPGERIDEKCVNILLRTGISHINVIK